VISVDDPRNLSFENPEFVVLNPESVVRDPESVVPNTLEAAPAVGCNALKNKGKTGYKYKKARRRAKARMPPPMLLDGHTFLSWTTPGICSN
jgi:hypothetical protein